MKVTFVALGSEQLAISLLANMAKSKGHDVSLAFSSALFHDRYNLEIPWLNKIFDDTEETIESIRQQEPEILVCSVLTATYQWMLSIAEITKQMFPDVKIIFGGVHVSAVPERVLKHDFIDFVVVGEGEEAFPAILDAIEQGDYTTPIYNTRFHTADGSLVRGEQRGFYQSLDKLPPFSKEIWEHDTFVSDHYITQASRGCPYRCTFCFNNFFTELPDNKATKGKYVRHRSVDHMLDELKWAKQRYKRLKWIDFQDDVFTTNKKWLKEFLPRYKKEIGVPFQCLTHPRYMDDEIAEMLIDAGCVWVQMGIQTMDDGMKNDIRRNEKSVHIKKALISMLKSGMKVKVDHMFGLPDEPIEAQETAREFYAEHCPARIQTFWTCFLPGTELLDQGMAAGLVTEEEAERLNEGVDFYFFRNAENIKNPKMVRMYQGYEMLFKIYPLFPRFMRVRMKETHIRWIPNALKGAIGFVGELMNAVRLNNFHFYVYAKYYRFHLTRFIRKKLGLKNTKPATRFVPGSSEVDLTAYQESLLNSENGHVNGESAISKEATEVVN